MDDNKEKGLTVPELLLSAGHEIVKLENQLKADPKKIDPEKILLEAKLKQAEKKIKDLKKLIELLEKSLSTYGKHAVLEGQIKKVLKKL